jgi:hypothetical protein
MVWIQEPEKSLSRIQGSKKHRIPDPDPQPILFLFAMNRFSKANIRTLSLQSNAKFVSKNSTIPVYFSPGMVLLLK